MVICILVFLVCGLCALVPAYQGGPEVSGMIIPILFAGAVHPVLGPTYFPV